MRAGWANFTVSGVGFAVFLVLAWQVHSDESRVASIDHDLAVDAQKHAEQHPNVLQFARIATDYGGIPVMVTLSVAGALLIWLGGQPKLALAWLLAAAGGALLNVASKDAVDRQRPDASLRDSVVVERNASFPSGHAMGSAIGYGALAYVGTSLMRRRWAKVTFATLMVLIIVLISMSRVYLRAHWCSDVIAGAALGLCWLSLCFGMARTCASESNG